MVLVVLVISGLVLLVSGDEAAAFVTALIIGAIFGLISVITDSVDQRDRSRRAAIRREANDRRRLTSTEWRRARTAALQRDRYRCVRCGRMAEEVDHIQPRAMGGAVYALSNLQSMCKSCHKRKTAQEAGQIRRYMRGE